MGNLPLHVLTQIAGKKGISIFSALTVEYQQVSAFQVDVFYAKRESLADPQATAVKMCSNKPILSFHIPQNGSDFLWVESRGHAPGRFRHLVLQVFDLPFQHVLVKEDDGAERLVLGGGTGPSIYGQMIQQMLNFVIAHHLRVLLIIEQNGLADPVEIGFLGSIAVLLRPDFGANRLQER